MTQRPEISVCTPSYNRSHRLPRVCDALAGQTFRDFEWIVVDDGSTDGTEAVVRSLSPPSEHPIAFLRLEPNRGMHVAMNRGIAAAHGRFLLKLDSDDYLVPEALERYLYHWHLAQDDERANLLAGVQSLCMDEIGQIWGDMFPSSPFISNYFTLRYRLKITGDKKGLVLTDVWRRFAYDEQPYLTSNPWFRISKELDFVFVNEPLYIYTTPSSADSISRGARLRPETRLYRSREQLNLGWRYFPYNRRAFLSLTSAYKQSSRDLGISCTTRWFGLNLPSRIVYAICLLLGQKTRMRTALVHALRSIVHRGS